MSSFAAANTSPSPAAATDQSGDGGSSSSNGSSSGGTSTALYLFTFLATLLLLLAVSCAIVLRSLIIRRRFQRRVQDALAHGTVLSPLIPVDSRLWRRGNLFGEKPRIWEAWLAPPIPKDNEPSWEALAPVSARVLSDRLTGGGHPIGSDSDDLSPSNSSNFESLPSDLSSFFSRFAPRSMFPSRRRLRRMFPEDYPPPSTSSSFPSTSQQNSGSSSDWENSDQANPPPEVTEEVKASLQVGVLIAMPSQYRPRAWARAERSRVSGENDLDLDLDPLHCQNSKGKARSERSSTDNEESDACHEEDVPDVVMGIAEVPWRVPIRSERPAPVLPQSPQNRRDS